MEFIEKHKALIITSMLMGIFVLSLYNINMINRKKEQSEILMEIPEELLAKMEEPEEELIEQEQRELIASKRTHNTFNEDFEDSEDFEQRIKSLTETAEASEEILDPNEITEGEAPIEEEIIEEKEELPDPEKEEKPESKEANSRHSSSSYTLKDRTVVGQLPNPIYTCNGSGKVVVKIEVNQNGYVVDAKIDKKKSSTRNECLFDNALNYARDALFSASEITEQKGSITYYFNYGG